MIDPSDLCKRHQFKEWEPEQNVLLLVFRIQRILSIINI